MTALPITTMPEGPIRREEPIPSCHGETEPLPVVRRVVLRGLGFSAVLAAMGLWLIPVVPGDAMMQLVKVSLSGLLVLVASRCWAALREPIGPTVTINPKTRTLTIIDFDIRGRVRMEASHSIDSLSEVILRDDLLTARDAYGRSLVTLPVSDSATKSALMKVLGLRAS